MIPGLYRANVVVAQGVASHHAGIEALDEDVSTAQETGQQIAAGSVADVGDDTSLSRADGLPVQGIATCFGKRRRSARLGAGWRLDLDDRGASSARSLPASSARFVAKSATTTLDSGVFAAGLDCSVMTGPLDLVAPVGWDPWTAIRLLPGGRLTLGPLPPQRLRPADSGYLSSPPQLVYGLAERHLPVGCATGPPFREPVRHSAWGIASP